MKMRVPRMILRGLLKFPALRKGLYDMFPDLGNRIKLFSTLDGESEQAERSSNYGAYKSNAWIFRAVQAWQHRIAELPLIIVNAKNKRIRNAPLDRFLNSPNPDLSTTEIWSRWCFEMATRGECGFEIIWSGGLPAEMWPHRPDDILVRAEKGSEIYGRIAGYKIERYGIKSYSLEPHEFLFSKFYNPINQYRGLAPMDAVLNSVVNEQLAKAWQFFFFKNQARPDYAIIAPGGLSPREVEALEKRLETRFGTVAGKMGHSKPIVLQEGITDIKAFSFPPNDIGIELITNLSREEVGAVYGVPRELMGGEVAKYENLAQAELLFLTGTVLPLLRLRDERLTHFFRREKLLGPTEKIISDISNVWALRRLLDPVYKQAGQLFAMGVPFTNINNYFGLGIEHFEADTISNPYGTPSTFDEQGNPINHNGANTNGTNGTNS